MYSDEEKHAPTAEQTRSKVGTGILQGCLLVTQNMYWATGFEDVCHRVDRRKFWQISYFDGTVVSLFKGTFSARQVYLHLKPKLLHFFKEIVQQKLLDKDWIQSVHNRFCSSILWVERKLCNAKTSCSANSFKANVIWSNSIISWSSWLHTSRYTEFSHNNLVYFLIYREAEWRTYYIC